MRRPELATRPVRGPLVGEEVGVGHFGGIAVMHQLLPNSGETGCGRPAARYQRARAVDAKQSWKAQPCSRCWLPKRRWTR